MTRGVRVLCPDCAAMVVHDCHNGLKRAVMEFLEWVPEYLGTPELEAALLESGKKNDWIHDENDPEDTFKGHPFFGSQNWSYPLFGSKDQARTFHALIHNLITAAGLDVDALEGEVHHRLQAKAAAEEQRQEELQKREAGIAERRAVP